jgi:hypothetical protein
MSSNFLISYDLHKPGQNYDAINKKIISLGGWAKIHQTYWYVKSSLSIEKIAEIVFSAMDKNDTLCVTDASSNEMIWHNLNPDVSTYIQKNWTSTTQIT